VTTQVAGSGPLAARRSEIARNLAAVEGRIVAACHSAGRAREEITLVAITKTFPASDAAHLCALGIHDLGENRDRDAAAKIIECERMGLTGLRWHFVGQVQTNKARSVASYAHLVHSVDRDRLVASLDRAAESAGRLLSCLVQVDLDERPQASSATHRGGVPPQQVLPLAAKIEGATHLVLRGVMAVAPLGVDAAVAFERLAAVAAEVRAGHPDAVIVSAGMTGDLEAAVALGATHLRVGTALLGSRPPLR
jgi:hypothetical protein